MNTGNTQQMAMGQYRQTQFSDIEQLNPHQLTQLVMKTVLDKISIAKRYMISGKVTQKGNSISKAISLIDCLRASLDHEKGGDIADNLNQLYDYMEFRLLEANLSNHVDVIDEVLQLMGDVKSAWDQVPVEFHYK